MDKVNVIFQQKHGRNFVTTWQTDDETRVYKDLSDQLISKKLCGCTYIRSIKRKQMYNGFVQITVTNDNGDRRIYTVASH